MSRQIDERIVEMQFINGDFEKKAKHTLNTLNELREGLDLEGAGESFGKLSEYATDNQASFSKLTKSGTKLSKSITSVGSVAKKAFSVATWPLKELGAGLKTINGYIGKYLGYNIASKLVGTAEQIARAFTIDPITQGWSQYSEMINSTKTIMAGSKKTYAAKMGFDMVDYDKHQEEHTAYVNQQLDRMQEYAQKTSYSFSDMTNNITKFTNAGVELGTATDAMIGIANAVALAGQDANSARMAFYNLGQAMGVGHLTTIDYKSLENANIMTTDLKDLFIELGVSLGELEKKTVKITETNAEGKKITKEETKILTKKTAEHKKQTEVTAENMRETLTYGWLTNEVMLAAFDIYSGAYDGSEKSLAALMARYHLTEEEASAAIKLGENAKKAASEISTLSKMMDALKESVQAGWASTWKLIVGDLGEATEFFTGLSDRIEKFLSGFSEARNELLQGWRGRKKNDAGEWVDVEGAIDGRDLLIETVNALLDIAGLVKNAFDEVKKAIFGEMTSERLVEITQKIRDFVVSIRDWLSGSQGQNGENRLQIVKNILGGILTFIRAIWNTTKRVASYIWKNVSPIFDKVGSFLGDVGKKVQEWFSDDLLGFFKKVSTFVKGITKEKLASWLGEVGKKFGELWSNIKGGIRNFAANTGLKNSPVYKFLVGVADWIGGAATDVYEAVSKFFGKGGQFEAIKNWIVNNIFEPVKSVFKPQETTNDDGEKIIGDSPIVSFLNAVVDWIKNTYTEIETTISNFFAEDGQFNDIKDWIVNNIFEPVTSVFKPQETTTDDGEKIIGDSPIVSFLNAVVDWIKNTYDTVKTEIEKFFAEGGEFDQIKIYFTDYIYNPINALFGANTVPSTKDSPKAEETPLYKFLTSVATLFGDAWSLVQQVPWDQIGRFFVDIFSGIVDVIHNMASGNSELKEATGELVAGGGESKGTEQEIQQATSTFDRILNAIGTFIGGIINAFTNVISAVDEATGLDLGKFMDNIRLIIEYAVEIVKTVLEFAAKIVTGKGNFGEYALAVFGVILAIADKIYEIIKLNKLTQITKLSPSTFEDFSTKLLKIAAAIALLAFAMSAIGGMDEASIAKGAVGIIILGGVVVGLMEAYGQVSKKLQGENTTEQKDAKTIWSGVVSKLITWVGIIASIAVVLALLPEVIKACKEADVPPGFFTDLALGLVTMLGGIVLITGLMAKFKIDIMSSVYASVGFAIILGSAILTLFVAILTIYVLFDWLPKAISNATGNGDIGLDYILDTVKHIMFKIGEIFGALAAGFGSGMTTGAAKAAENIKEAEDSLSSIDTNTFTKLADIARKVIEFVAVLNNMMGENTTKIIKPTLLKQTNIDTKALGAKIKLFSEYLVTVSQAFAEAETKLRGANLRGIDWTVFDHMTDVALKLSTVAEKLAMAKAILSVAGAGPLTDPKNNPISQLAEMLIAGVKDFGQFAQDDPNLSNALSSVMQLLNTSFTEAADQFSVDPLIGAIAEKLTSEENTTTIANAFRTMAANLFSQGLISSDPLQSGGLNIGSFFGGFGELFSGFGDLVNEGGTLSSMFGDKGLLGDLLGNFDYNEQFSSVKTTIEQLGSDLATKVDTSSYETTGKNIAEKLTNGFDSTIGEYSGNGVPLTVSTVITDEELQTLLNGTSIEITGTVSIDQMNLDSINNTIKTEGLALRSAMNSVGLRISQLETAIKQMQVVLDSGALVGYIDTSLGRRSAYNSRIQTASMP